MQQAGPQNAEETAMNQLHPLRNMILFGCVAFSIWIVISIQEHCRTQMETQTLDDHFYVCQVWSWVFLEHCSISRIFNIPWSCSLCVCVGLFSGFETFIVRLVMVDKA